jgi:flavin reductase (DIM6/NTAB) family NADH-FMN oxidoreductase RutF
MNTGEFVINLTTSALCRQTDFCGVKSGRNIDKIAACGFHTLPSEKIAVPIIEECPVALECKVTESKPLGSHTMFLAEIVGIDVDDKYIDSKGKLNLQQCGLTAYAHGEYFALGRKLGDFGFSVRKKKKNHGNKNSR